jgi:hypothetical protein
MPSTPSLTRLRALTLNSSIVRLLNNLQRQHHQPCPTNHEWKRRCCCSEDQHGTFPGMSHTPLK